MWAGPLEVTLAISACCCGVCAARAAGLEVGSGAAAACCLLSLELCYRAVYGPRGKLLWVGSHPEHRCSEHMARGLCLSQHK